MLTCPLCQETVKGVMNLRMHIASCKSYPTEIEVKRFIATPSSVTSSEESSKDFPNNESELRTTQQTNKAYEPKCWSHVRTEKVDPVLVDKHYKVKHENRSTLLVKSSIAKNTLVLPNFLVWKFCRKAQFPNSFGQFVRNYVETVPFHKIYTPGN